MRRSLVKIGFLLMLVAGFAVEATGQSSAQTGSAASATTLKTLPPSATRPGRDPSQPIDEEYTRKIHEYTTEPFFLSPLVDYLPASSTVPTPAVTLGDIAGAPNKL